MRLGADHPGIGLRIVGRDVGALQLLVALGMLLSLGVSLIYGETYTALSFLAAAGATGAVGALAFRLGRGAREPERRHAMIIAAAGWVVSALFGALPFLLAALWTPPDVARAFVPPGQTYESSLIHFRNPLHAFFESMSAYTTTGLTMAVHEPSIGHGLLFYRSLAQWIGGVGVIVLSLAIIPRPRVVGEMELYQTETAGFKLRPSVVGTARAIWKAYAILTLLVALYLFLATLLILPGYGLAPSLFNAVNHAMTGMATGGFSTLDNSIGDYGSAAMEIAHVPPMILGAISIPLFYAFVRRRDLRVFWREAQFRAMARLLAGLAPLLVLLLWTTSTAAHPIREGVFQVVSAISTTGWQTSDIHGWAGAAMLLLVWGAMLFGGAAGSTSGGIKLIRGYLLIRAVGWRIRRVFRPASAVVPFRLDDRYLTTEAMQGEVAHAAVFTFLYLLLLAAATIVVAHETPAGFAVVDAVFEAASAQSSTGLSTGLTGPEMPVTIEIVFILQMWVGRLEIFPVLVLLRALASWTLRR